MNKNLDATPEHLTPVEREIEQVLRPLDFGSFAGQPGIVENLRFLLLLPHDGAKRWTMCCCTDLRAWGKQPFPILLPTKWASTSG